MQAARNHYNCPTLRGPLLENEGGALSIGLVIHTLTMLIIWKCFDSTHWESRTLFPEVMNAVIYTNLAKYI